MPETCTVLRNRKLIEQVAALSRSVELLSGSLTSGQALAGRDGKPETWWDRWTRRLGPVVAVVTVVTAVMTVLLLNSELRTLSRQTASAESALRAETRSRDSGFLSGVSSRVTDDGIVISNSNRTPVTPFAYWLLQADGDTRVQEIEGAVQSLAPCSSMTVEWSRLGDVRKAGEPIGPSAYTQLKLPFGDASELHLAVQAPSGEWFLAGSSGSLSAIDLVNAPETLGEDRLPQDRDPSNEAPHLAADLGEDGALKALRAADLYRNAPDTYLEGFEGGDNYLVTYSVGSPGNSVTGTGGDGVRTKGIACSD